MSLFRFFETNIQENPDLLLLNHQNHDNTDGLYKYFLSKQRKTLFHSFTDILLNDVLSRCAKTPIEYEILKIKSRNLAENMETSFKSKYTPNQ